MPFNKPHKYEWVTFHEDGTIWELHVNGGYSFTWIVKTVEGRFRCKVNSRVPPDRFATMQSAARYVEQNFDLAKTYVLIEEESHEEESCPSNLNSTTNKQKVRSNDS